jgi:L-asparaginase II
MTHVFSKPLIYLKRAGITEEIIHGAYYFHEKDVGIYGDNFPVISSALFNPLHFLALEVDLKNFNLLAALAATPGKGEGYFDIVKGFATANNVQEDELICGRQRPPEGDSLEQSRFYNPYALHHVLLVAICKRDNMPIGGYWEEGHPVQERIFSIVGKITSEPTTWCTDKSGLPTAITSAKTLLKVWDELEDADLPFTTSLFENLKNEPQLISQGNTFEAEVMTAFSGKLAVLSNDNGTFLIRSIGEEKPFGMVVKFASNMDRKYIPFGILAAIIDYPFENPLVKELEDYLESRTSGMNQNGLEVSFN